MDIAHGLCAVVGRFDIDGHLNVLLLDLIHWDRHERRNARPSLSLILTNGRGGEDC